ncbi:MAG: response regulator [Pyrinomonadaceae bacterium]
MQFEESQKINILMVDDNPTNLLALEAILDAPDRNLVRASSGTEALRFLLDEDFAVILLDVYMPGLDGLETAALIRGREKSRDIPIIFLTADSTGGAHIAKGYSLGAVDYILKPVEPEILRSKIAVFVELFKKTLQVKQQAELLHEKNIELENANLQRLQMLIELGQRLAAERDPAQLLEKFCHSARDIVGAECATVGVYAADGRTLEHCLTSGPADVTAVCAGTPQTHEGFLSTMLKERRPLRLCDIGSAPELANLPSPHKPKHSFLGAPILLPSHAYGWLYLSDKMGAEEFSEADERLAATLTSQVAVAYENASLYAASQRHAAALSQEVAERKQAEEERARLLVLEQEARAEAEAANRTKDEFLATLSHELRTPLTSILGWIHLVRSGNLDASSINRAHETIERNARSQSQLIDDLLDVSRIITGKLHINIRAVELAPIIEAAIELARPSAEAKEIELHTQFDPATATTVSGDPVRLQQIVWNLLANAVKFTPTGGRVDVRLSRTDSSVELSVKDSGMGISPDFLPHIFDRFRQADGTTTRSHGGLGLGLAIVRHLVELHHGTVEAASDGDGHGAEFTVAFPPSAVRFKTQGEAERAASATGGVTVGASEDVSAMLYGLRVLVVDDEPDAREVVAAVLRQSGAEVHASGSVADALEQLEAWQPNLLVSDIGMPGEDGYALIKKVRALDAAHLGEIPAVALTAYASTEDRARALSAGFQLHVAKPVEPLQLVEAVAALARRNGQLKAESSNAL